MRVFYDTNVLLSILLWPGEAHRMHATLIERGIVPVTSERVVEEALAVLERKFKTVDRTAVEASIREVWEVAPKSSQTPSHTLRDPADDFVLADAEAAGVAVLLTGDRDLLDEAGNMKTLEVLSVRELHERYLGA
jgi:putative PIN family toxin of toxin-antitoxin system